jgi:ABC-2 type transport system permease protein
MPEPLLLYWQFVVASLKSQMQYRASFLFSALGQFLATGIEIVGIWALFERFGSLTQWTLPQVAMFYGVVHCSFAIADALSSGFDQFSIHLRTGDFDRLLLRPRGTVLQLMGQELALRRIGRLLQGVMVLGWAIWALDIQWGWLQVGLLAFTIFGGACLFLGLLVLQATIAFWTIETLELMNTMTYGGVETAQYPMAIYQPALRRFFTFVVPLACVTYFPVVALLGTEEPLGTSRAFQYAAPLAGWLFLWGALQAWKYGVRHYTSTGR